MRELEPSPTVVIGSRDPYRLQALLRREHGRRAIIVRSPISEVTPGLWQVEVIQLRPLRPVWVVPAVTVVGVTAAGAFCWWLVGAVTSLLASLGVASIVGCGVLMVAAWLAARRPRGGGGCRMDIHITHRH